MSFRFKQFFVQDDRCAMKVGTDGVLLGAWTPFTNHKSQITNTPYRVLDIGTGSGLIALMLAQRCSEAQIDAIDIDEAAIQQAQENFAASPWNDRLHATFARLQDLQIRKCEDEKMSKCYDLVVSNPPYFRNSLKNPDLGRQTARHTDTLSYDDLMCHSARLLSDNGQLALILPAEAEQEVCELATANNLFLTHITRVYSKESKPARRVLLAFIKSPCGVNRSEEMANGQSPVIKDSLVLENEIGGRSAAYQELCKEFYL